MTEVLTSEVNHAVATMHTYAASWIRLDGDSGV